MKVRRWVGWALVAAGSLFVAVQASRLQVPTSETLTGTRETIAPPLRVFAGIPPVAYLAERVGGEHVQVEVLVQPGQDPHLFEPTPRQAMSLSKARLLLKVGMPFENRLIERIAAYHPGLSVIDTTLGIRKRQMTEHGCEHEHEGGEEHQHGDDEGQAGDLREERQVEDSAHDGRQLENSPHGEADPHVWLSPPLLKIMAANVAAALCEADPDHQGEYRANLAGLEAELDTLHVRIAEALKPYRGQSFYVFHPAFGYFGDTYHLIEKSVEMEGKSPTPRQLRQLIQSARADGVKIIFLQPQFDQRSAEVVAAAIGGAVMPMDDLAKDVLKNLDDVAQKIAQAIGNETLKMENCKRRTAGLGPICPPCHAVPTMPSIVAGGTEGQEGRVAVRGRFHA